MCLAGLVVLERSGLSAPADARLPLVLLGAGIGLSSPAAKPASMSGVAAGRSGMAAGVGSTVRYLGAVADIAVLARGLDVDGTRSEVLAQHRAVLLVFAVVLVASVVCAALLPRRTADVAVQPAPA